MELCILNSISPRDQFLNISSACVSMRVHSSDDSYFDFDAMKEFVKSDEFVKEILSGKYGEFDGNATFLEGSGQMVLKGWISKFMESIAKDERFRKHVATNVQTRRLGSL